MIWIIRYPHRHDSLKDLSCLFHLCHWMDLLKMQKKFSHQTDTVQQVEVDMMLRTVLEFKQRDSAQIVLVAHCLAMLWFLEGDHKKVK